MASAMVAIGPSPRTLGGRTSGMTALAGFAEVPDSHAAGGAAVLIDGFHWAGAWRVSTHHESSLLPVTIVSIPMERRVRGGGCRFRVGNWCWSA